MSNIASAEREVRSGRLELTFISSIFVLNTFALFAQ